MIIKLLLYIVLLSGYISCNKSDDYVYYANPPRQEAKDTSFLVRDIFKDAKIDILFVVDNSGSMGSIQQNIVKNAALFMENFLKNNDMKWKMGIISTDKGDAPYLGFASPFDNNFAMANTSQMVVDTFKRAVNDLGVYGDASEYVFFNTHRVMREYPFEQFFRPDAHLAVIMVTDEHEQSEEEYGAQYGPLSFINTIRSLKDPGKIVRFYGAFNFDDLKSCKPSFEPPYKGSPFERVIVETGGIHMSACTSDFGKELSDIGKDILSIVDSPKMLLEARPVIDTLRVYYEDKLLPGGRERDGGKWYYSEKHSTINFYNLDFMEDKEKGSIRITYDVDDGVDRGEDAN